jgi:hypothetical protein
LSYFPKKYPKTNHHRISLVFDTSILRILFDVFHRPLFQVSKDENNRHLK